MWKILICVVLNISFVAHVVSEEMPDFRKDFVASLNSNYELTPLKIEDLSSNPIRSRAAVVFTILLHTYEWDIHRMRGAVHNEVYSDLHGHEAVFEFETDENGQPIKSTAREVTDCINMANYNYFHQSKFPLAHFSVDILPWILEGNCEEDPTSIQERIEAYVSDFERGIKNVIDTKSGYYHPKFIGGKNKGQLEALSFLFKALEVGGFNINNLTPVNYKSRKTRFEIADALEKGLKEMLVEA